MSFSGTRNHNQNKLRALGALFLCFLFLGSALQKVFSCDLKELPFLPCFFHKITGVPCPGCGMTKAFLSLGSFQFKEAFSYNPFSFFLMSFLIIFVISPRLAKPLEQKGFLLTLLSLVLLFWVKNLYNLL